MSFWPFCCKSPQVYTFGRDTGASRQFCNSPGLGSAYPEVRGRHRDRFAYDAPSDYDLPSRLGAEHVDNQIRWKSLSWEAGVRDNGTLWVFGKGIKSQKPTQVGDDEDWDEVQCGFDGVVLCKKTDGTLWSFGPNQDGGLGIGLHVYDESGTTPRAYRAKISSSIDRFSPRGNPEQPVQFSKKPEVQIRCYIYGKRNSDPIDEDFWPDASPSTPAEIECDWTGRVDSITVQSGGAGYTSRPSVLLKSTTGDSREEASGAKAMVTKMGEVPVQGFSVLSPGSGYTSATATEMYTGATASAVIGQGGAITQWSLIGPGSKLVDILSPPAMRVVVSGDGQGAAASADIAGSWVEEIEMVNNPECWTEPPVVEIVGGSGSGAAAVVQKIIGSVADKIRIINAGGGYTQGQQIRWELAERYYLAAKRHSGDDEGNEGESEWILLADVVLSPSSVASVARADEHLLTDAQKEQNEEDGTLYGFFHRRATTTGEVPPFKFRTSEQEILEGATGVGYPAPEYFTLSNMRSRQFDMFLVGPGGAPEIKLSKKKVYDYVERIVKTSPGSTSYSEPPAVVISGGGGSGAAATVTLTPDGYIDSLSIVVTDGGSGYVRNPTAKLVGGTPNYLHPSIAAIVPDVWEFSLESAAAGFSSPAFLVAKATDPVPGAKFAGDLYDAGIIFYVSPVGVGEFNEDGCYDGSNPDWYYIIGNSFFSSPYAPRIAGSSLSVSHAKYGAATFEIINGWPHLRSNAESPVPPEELVPLSVRSLEVSVPISDDFTFAAYVTNAWFKPLSHEYEETPPHAGNSYQPGATSLNATNQAWVSGFLTNVPWIGPSIDQETRFYFPKPEQERSDEPFEAAFAVASVPEEYGIKGFVGVGAIQLVRDGYGYREEPIPEIESNSFREPVQIPGSWTSFSAGPPHCGVQAGGQLMWWGDKAANSRHAKTVMAVSQTGSGVEVAGSLGAGEPTSSPTPVGRGAAVDDWEVGSRPAFVFMNDLRETTTIYPANAYIVPPDHGTHLAVFRGASHSTLYGEVLLFPYIGSNAALVESMTSTHRGVSTIQYAGIGALCHPGLGFTSPPQLKFMACGPSVYEPTTRLVGPDSFGEVREGLAKSSSGAWFDLSNVAVVYPPANKRTPASTSRKETYFVTSLDDVSLEATMQLSATDYEDQYVAYIAAGGSGYSFPTVLAISYDSRYLDQTGYSGTTTPLPNCPPNAVIVELLGAYSLAASPQSTSVEMVPWPDSSLRPWAFVVNSVAPPTASITGNGSGADFRVALSYNGLVAGDADPLPLTPVFVEDHEFPTRDRVAVTSSGEPPRIATATGFSYVLPQVGVADSAGGGLMRMSDGTLRDYSKTHSWWYGYFRTEDAPYAHVGPLAISVEHHGKGYDNPAIVEIDQPSGVAEFEVTYNGKLVGIGVANGGSGYGEPPDVLGDVPSSKCTIVGPVGSVQLTSGGSGYRYPPDVVFSPPGIPARATAKIRDGVVEAIDVIDGGRYRSRPSVTIAPVKDIEEIVVTAPGGGFTSAPSVVVGGGGGEGASATCRIWGGIKEVILLSGGSGYESSPEVQFVGGGGEGATAIATVANGQVVSIVVSSPGDFYETEPGVRIVGAGAGAIAGAVLDGRIRDVTILERGHHYAVPPKVIFVGGGGGYAEADAVLGSPGGGAAAQAKLNGSVLYVDVEGTQEDYEFPPEVQTERVSEPTVEAPQDASLKARIVGKVTEIEPVQNPSTGKYSRLQLNSPSFFGDRIPADVSLIGSAVESHALIHSAGKSRIVPSGENESEDAPRGGQPIAVDLLSGLARKEFYHKPQALAYDSFAVAADTCLTLSGYVLEKLSGDTCDSADVLRVDWDSAPASESFFSISDAGISHGYMSGDFAHTPEVVSPVGQIKAFVKSNSSTAGEIIAVARQRLYSEQPTIDIEDEVDGGASLLPIDGEMLVRQEGEEDDDLVRRLLVVDEHGEGHTLRARPAIRGGVPAVWGTPAAATATIDGAGRVASISVDSTKGYSRPPRVYVVGGGGEGAIAGEPVLTEDGGIASIPVLNGGEGYDEAPRVFIIDEEKESHRDPEVVAMFESLQEWACPVLQDWKIEYTSVVHRTQRTMPRVLPQRITHGLLSTDPYGSDTSRGPSRRVIRSSFADNWAFDTDSNAAPGPHAPRYRIHPIYDDSGYVENLYIARYSQSKAYKPNETPEVTIVTSGNEPAEPATAMAEIVLWSDVYGSRYYYAPGTPHGYHSPAYGAIMPESDDKEI